MAVVGLHLCRLWAACPEAACCFSSSLRRLLLYDVDDRPLQAFGRSVVILRVSSEHLVFSIKPDLQPPKASSMHLLE